VLYIASMWIAGVMQGLMWRATNPDGTLTYSFVEAVRQLPVLDDPCLGGVLFLTGMLIMALQHGEDDRRSEGLQAPVLAPAGAHA
jgi:cytochrome c oxidase cbb3-type subunit 1